MIFSAHLLLRPLMSIRSQLWAVDLDTKNNTLTKSLLSYYLSCPADGDWPATSSSSTAEVPCGPDADFPEETQTRVCNADLTWGTVDSSACRVVRPVSYAAQNCLEGQ